VRLIGLLTAVLMVAAWTASPASAAASDPGVVSAAAVTPTVYLTCCDAVGPGTPATGTADVVFPSDPSSPSVPATGTLTVILDGVVVASAAVHPGDIAFGFMAPAAGDHTMVGLYSGDANFSAAQSSALGWDLGAYHTESGFGSSNGTSQWSCPPTNPGPPPGADCLPAVRPGQPITYTIQLYIDPPVAGRLPAGLVPSGTVTFYLNAVPAAEVTLDRSGAASWTTSFNQPGTYGVFASYAGDGIFAPVVSGVAPERVAAARSGYWMMGNSGLVYPFGAAQNWGDPSTTLTGARAAKIEPSPSGDGYWIVDTVGHVYAYGDAPNLGAVAPGVLVAGELVTTLTSTPSGDGYWISTTLGRILAFGDAGNFGSLLGIRLDGPILGSVATPSGKGYYLVAADGGIFSFGDAVFYGSMGAHHLNAPIGALIPTADNRGYWLVAADGGIFAFGDAVFQGSMGATHLDEPVCGAVRYGNGYLMVAQDGGIFDFSDRPFAGSLGANPPAQPIVSVAAIPT
jgi:hypothetical protein